MNRPACDSLWPLDRFAGKHRDTFSRLRLWKARRARLAGRRVRRGVRNEEGSQLVEFALTCGILMTFLIGLVQITLAVYAYHYISDAAREATRWAMVRGSACVGLTGCGAGNSAIQTYVRNLGYPGITAANLTTTTTWYTETIDATATPPTAVLASCGTTPGGGCDNPGNQVKVQVTYALPVNIPFVPHANLNITSTSAMVISQ